MIRYSLFEIHVRRPARFISHPIRKIDPAVAAIIPRAPKVFGNKTTTIKPAPTTMAIEPTIFSCPTSSDPTPSASVSTGRFMVS